MITTLLLGELVAIITTIFSFFDPVTVLPTIANVNLDTIIIGGIGNVMALAHVFWYITDIIQGFLFISGYYVLKLTIRFIARALDKFGGAALN